jgi:hypothetical protein
MSEEVVLKIGDGGFILREKDGNKFNFNPPRGNLILTDKRVIFAKSSVGFGKRLAVGVGAGLLIADRVWKKWDKVKPEEIDRALQLEGSFALLLTDISTVRAEKGIKGLTNSKLSIIYNISSRVASCSFFISGGLLGSAPPNDWVDSIMSAKAPK